MIQLTKLDGSSVYVNEANIQWMEALPDTAITFLGGARVIVRESVDAVISLMKQAHAEGFAASARDPVGSAVQPPAPPPA